MFLQRYEKVRIIQKLFVNLHHKPKIVAYGTEPIQETVPSSDERKANHVRPRIRIISTERHREQTT